MFPLLKTLAVSIISPNNFGNASDAAAVIARKTVPKAKSHRLVLLIYLNNRSDCSKACLDIFVLGSLRSIECGPAMDTKFSVFYYLIRGNLNK